MTKIQKFAIGLKKKRHEILESITGKYHKISLSIAGKYCEIHQLVVEKNFQSDARKNRELCLSTAGKMQKSPIAFQEKNRKIRQLITGGKKSQNLFI